MSVPSDNRNKKPAFFYAVGHGINFSKNPQGQNGQKEVKEYS